MRGSVRVISPGVAAISLVNIKMLIRGNNLELHFMYISLQNFSTFNYTRISSGVCLEEMGLQNQKIIQDTQLTASSQKLAFGPELARMSVNEYQGSWMPRYAYI